MSESREWMNYVAVIECPDGRTYEQPYYDYEDLVDLLDYLGDGYSIRTLY